jgi:CheY-like chemotaxis protein
MSLTCLFFFPVWPPKTASQRYLFPARFITLYFSFELLTQFHNCMRTLKEFAVFLNEERTPAIAETASRLIKTHSIPVMKFFIPLTEKLFVEKLRLFIRTELLEPMASGTFSAPGKEKMKQLKWNLTAYGLSGVPVKQNDLVHIFSLLEEVLVSHLPYFTDDLKEGVAISSELKRYFTRLHAEGVNRVAEMERRVKEENGQGQDHIASEKLKLLSNMSHEVRTPMNAIIGFAKVVLGSELNAKQRDYLTAIKKSGENLLLLINDIFDLAETDGHKISFEQLAFKAPPAVSRSEAKSQLLNGEQVIVKGIRVLVVEDVALNQFLMKTILDNFGFEHDLAANGKIALEKLAVSNYDIVLMDLQMPVMNGHEATRIIRNEMGSAIPIIALSADVTPADVKRCKDEGMNEYISKPVDDKLLYRKIIELTGAYRKMKRREWSGAAGHSIPDRRS